VYRCSGVVDCYWMWGHVSWVPRAAGASALQTTHLGRRGEVRPRSCEVGPISGMPRVSHRQYAQGVEEWSDIGHQDMLTSDIGKSNNKAGPREVDPRPLTSYQLGRSLGHEGPCVWCG